MVTFNKNKRFFLFSGGQDSILFFFLALLQEDKKQLQTVFLNHQTQINNYSVMYHLNFFSFLFQKNNYLVFLKTYKTSEIKTNEEYLRLARYQIISRLTLFFSILNCSTAHTSSDLIETSFFNYIRNSSLEKLQPTFTSKKIFQKNYHQNFKQSLLINSDFFTNKTKKRRLKKSSFFKISQNQKFVSLLNRPLKKVSRMSSKIITLYYRFPFFIDQTNFSFLITRNKIRRHLILYIDSFLNSNFFTLKSEWNSKLSFLKKNTRKIRLVEFFFSGFSSGKKNYYLFFNPSSQSAESCFLFFYCMKNNCGFFILKNNRKKIILILSNMMII